MKRRHDPNIGGEQGLLFEPFSDWKPPLQLPDLRQYDQIAIDLETKDNGLQLGKGPGWAFKNKPPWHGYICGLSIAWHDSQYHAGYFPLQHPSSHCFDKTQVRQWLLDHQKAGVEFIFHNATYDIGWCEADLAVPVPALLADTGCMAYLVDENRLSYTLDSLCKWRKLPGKNEDTLRDAAYAHGYNPKNDMWRLPAKYVGVYAEQDALSTLMLAENLDKTIDIDDVRAAYQLEIDLIPMVHAMRKHGVRIDEDRCRQLYDKYKKQSQEALNDISDRLEHRITIEDVRSAKTLEKIFDGLGIKYPRTAKTQQGSFEAKWMKDHKHWLPPLIVRAKSREDAAEKFIKNYLQEFCVNGRLHPSINQFRHENLYKEDARGGGTRTYRFSYSDPPLQQIPHRDQEMSEIRSCFIPEEGEEWLSADFKSQEYRLFVHYAAASNLPKAKEILNRYHENPETDFHQWVADITGLDRKPAKDANFGVIYGAGKRKFAMMIKKTEEEAERILEIYHREIPFAKMLSSKLEEVAALRGYIKLLDGARIRFDWWVAAWRKHGVDWEGAMADCHGREEAERRTNDPAHPWYRQRLRRSRCNKALNSLIQGGAARQIKSAMRDCWRAGLVPLLQVHDELCFSVPNREIGVQIGALMRDTVKLQVPMLVDLEYGESWAVV
jgi:Mesyanzhinovviridae DNA polymerase